MSAEIAAAKREARRAADAAAAAIPAEDRAAASGAIARSLASLPAWRSSRVVLLYTAIGSEPDLSPLVPSSLGEGKILLLPRSLPEIRSIEAVRIDSPGLPLSADPLGVPSPGGPAFDPARIDLVAVPGVAFDRGGVRLGRGGGYYDRFLATLRGDCLRVGICLDCRLADRLPAEPHDLAMDLVLTERRTIETPLRKSPPPGR